jgi:DNA-binding YbaB/EbfC family protein
MQNMQALLKEANKMKARLTKEMNKLAEQEFTVTKGGGIKVAMLGSREIVEISIEDDLFEKDNKEMIETMIILAINELLEKISSEEERINREITGGNTGLF